MSIRSFNTLALGASLLAVSIHCLGDDVIPDAEHWYRQGYALLWAEETWEKVDEVARYYAPLIESRSPDGETKKVDSREWLNQAIAGWKAEGWVGSDLASLQSSKLSDAEVLFKARWLDRYRNGSQEYTCGEYHAALVNGSWQFQGYRDADCPAEHSE